MARKNKCETSDITDEQVNNFKIEDLDSDEQIKWNVEWSIDNIVFQTLMTLFTIFALFGDDIRLWVMPSSLDNLCFALAVISLILFT